MLCRRVLVHTTSSLKNGILLGFNLYDTCTNSEGYTDVGVGGRRNGKRDSARDDDMCAFSHTTSRRGSSQR